MSGEQTETVEPETSEPEAAEVPRGSKTYHMTEGLAGIALSATLRDFVRRQNFIKANADRVTAEANADLQRQLVELLEAQGHEVEPGSQVDVSPDGRSVVVIPPA